jgi:hypothetical protein
MMKWTYKNCAVEITAVKKPPSLKFVPTVEITPYGTEDRIRIIISESFTTSSMAEKNGQDSAREWIDKHLK